MNIIRRLEHHCDNGRRGAAVIRTTRGTPRRCGRPGGRATRRDAWAPSRPLDRWHRGLTAMEGVVDDGRAPPTGDSGDGGSGGDGRRRRRSYDSDATATDVDVIEDHAPADVIDQSGKRPPTTPAADPLSTAGQLVFLL